ncbi:hypothetical protein LSAT2_018885 [Lamellibrachia satsuma]|nr:hypothetical protein LSAT2_018885 [Lamellibrachia satsuma]
MLCATSYVLEHMKVEQDVFHAVQHVRTTRPQLITRFVRLRLDGASRCGLLCAASYVLEHMKVEQEVDVFHAVQHVRTTRPQLIKHLAQYRFLYQVTLAYMSQFDTYANFQ